MTSEPCHVGELTPLPTALQQSYNTLQALQCTNLTYIRTFYHKMLTFGSDPEGIFTATSMKQLVILTSLM